MASTFTVPNGSSMPAPPAPADNPALRRFALLTAAATFLLVWMGGLVTSHEAGMSVPDWPNTYGYNMFFFPVSKWLGGIFFEHTHRLVASGVGLLTTILALWLFGRNSRPLLRWGGVLFLLAGIALCLIPQSAIRNPSRWIGTIRNPSRQPLGGRPAAGGHRRNVSRGVLLLAEI